MELQGIVESTVFRNEENGYTVLQLHAGREHVTAVGIMPPLTAGEQVTLEGDWIQHPQYGKQLKASACRVEKPTTLLGIERFLASGLIKGVGRSTAKLIVQEFGTRALDVIGEDPQKLTVISGIGKKRAKMIGYCFQEQYAAREAMIFLQSYGISPNLAVKISKRYGQATQQLLRENPYRLMEDIEGVGFTTADRIALAMGISTDSEFRLKGGLKFALSDASQSEGHTYLPENVLLRRAGDMLKVPAEVLEHHLDELLFKKELTAAEIDGVRCVFITAMYQAEAECAKRLINLRGKAQTGLKSVLAANIRRYERANSITLSDSQKQAVCEALDNGLFIITGGPGTGKTTIINCILSLLNGDALLAAPTGRAAKRMSEATGREAKTLHRLLEYSGEDGHFTRDEDNPLDTPCVIVDEVSMVDLFLMRSLLRALRSGTRLILVGDADQLPSVGAGNVLSDMLASGVIPSARLTVIFRQSEESDIVTNAHRINRGEMPVLNRKNSDFFFDRQLYPQQAVESVVGLCVKRLPGFLHTDRPMRDIQVLSPTKKGDCGVIALNRMLQEALNPPHPRKPEISWGDRVYRLGDKVMHIKNDYQIEWTALDGEEGTGAFNGDIGYITAVDKEENTLSVLYDDERTVEYEYSALEEIDLAYCLSVHKSQGSEFPCVVMPVTGGPRMLLNRNLFYTALTRARKLVVLVGREDCIADMVNNDHINARYTALKERLEDYDSMGR